MYPVSFNWTPDSSFIFTMTKTIGDSLGVIGDLNHSLNPYEINTQIIRIKLIGFFLGWISYCDHVKECP